MAYGPSQMFEHGIDPVRGYNTDLNHLDCIGRLHEDVTFTMPAGRVVHVDSLDSAGKPVFKPGAHNTSPAIFLFQGSDHFDVSNPGVSAGGIFGHKAIAPAGWMSGLVALGGFELEDTEYDKDQTYETGELLTASANLSPANLSGVITNKVSAQPVEQYEDPVIGIVSTGERTNHNGVGVLGFWTAWLPGAAA